jgi:hypothetical protein
MNILMITLEGANTALSLPVSCNAFGGGDGGG